MGTRNEPYWSRIDESLYIGLRKGVRGGKWIARRYTTGKYHYGVLGQPDDHIEADGAGVLTFFQAQAKARAWAKVALAGGREQLRPYTVGDVMDAYLDWFEHNRRSFTSTRQSVQKHIRETFQSTPADELTTRSIRRWHHGLAGHRGNADESRAGRATANRVLTIFKAALNFGFREGMVASDQAWRRVQPFRDVESPRIRYLDIDESKRLTNACALDFRGLVQAALLTGARYGELTHTEVQDYLPDAGAVRFRFTKSGKPRVVPLTVEGQKFFASVQAGRPSEDRLFKRSDGSAWNTSHQARRMADACAAARISPAISFHILRHTYAASIAMRGVPLTVIANVLGHSDTRVTARHYAHLAPSYVAEMVRANVPDLGITITKKVTRLRGRK